MSGYICGNIVLNGKEPGNFDEVFDQTVINQYKLDRFDYSVAGNAQFACGIIHVTKEDEFETLPFYDAEAGLFITADVILDNRDDLIKDLALSGTDKVITDGFIVLEAYKKWGHDTPKHLLGDFAFAIWDSKKEELFITRDHTGTRSLYYTKDENSIRFSTTINPIALLKKNEEKLICEEWLTMYLALPPFITEYDSKLTMYKNIQQCPIAESLVFSKKEIKKLKFWDPLSISKRKDGRNPKFDYINYFKLLFEDVVKCCVRGDGDTAILLSGGLDSTSVAAIAATELYRANKNLYSYTSIPICEVKEYSKKYYTINEKNDVETLVSHFPNIIPSYLECPNQDVLTVMDDLIKITELPYKAIENMTWINECYKKASSKGCKLLLTGFFGNFTISRGDFLTHVQTLISKGRFFWAWKEVQALSRIKKKSKKFVIKKIIVRNVPESLKKLKRKLYREKETLYSQSINYLDEELVKKYSIIEKLKNEKMYEFTLENDTFSEQGNRMLSEMLLTQTGAYDTKLGLHYGLITRDPTKDVRIIEFCLNAPFNLFVENGIERKLIREIMNEILPDEIIMNYNKRGLQGVDWNKRLVHKEDIISKEISLIRENHKLCHYLNKEKLSRLLEVDGDLFEQKNAKELKGIIILMITSKVLNLRS